MGTLKRAWHIIEADVLEEFVGRRPRRVIAVFRANGLYTKYQNINAIEIYYISTRIPLSYYAQVQLDPRQYVAQ